MSVAAYEKTFYCDVFVLRHILRNLLISTCTAAKPSKKFGIIYIRRVVYGPRFEEKFQGIYVVVRAPVPRRAAAAARGRYLCRVRIFNCFINLYPNFAGCSFILYVRHMKAMWFTLHYFTFCFIKRKHTCM